MDEPSENKTAVAGSREPDETTRLERWKETLENNRVVASILLAVTILIGIGAVTGAVKDVRDFIESLGGDSSTGLRFEIQDPQQAFSLASPHVPSLAGARVFCDTAAVTLLVSQQGAIPIRISTVGVHSEPVPDANLGATCEIDPLSTKPNGIVLVDTYMVDVGEDGMQARFLGNAGQGNAWPVAIQNVLQEPNGTKAILLTKEDPIVGLKFIIHTTVPGVQRLWFSARYDAGGEKTLTTSDLLIGK